MRHFSVQRFARLTLYAALAQCALACGADSDHGPTIGAPTVPIGPVIDESGGASSQAGGSSQSGNPGQPDPIPGTGGAAADATAGAFGSGGRDSLGTAGNGSAGRDPFGIAGSSSSDPFGIAGGPSASAGLGSF